MKHYLITLKNNQQFIATDEEISNNMDDFVFADNKVETIGQYFFGLQEKVYTKPLPIIAGLKGLPEISYSELTQVPEIDFDDIRVVDTEKLANDIADKKYGGGQSPSYYAGFQDGFEAAQELSELQNKQTAIDFAMYLVSKTMVQGTPNNMKEYVPREFEYLQGILTMQGAKIFKEFQDLPKIFEIEVDMECVGFDLIHVTKVLRRLNNQIEITKILKML